METEFLLLIASVLFFVSIFVSNAGNWLGVPVLLLFLAVGMLFGTDGLRLLDFNNIQAAKMIGTLSI